MEERNVKLREGLTQLHTSQVLGAVAMVLMFIPLVNIVALIMAIVGAVMALLAMLKLNDLHPDYKTAVNLLAINVALAVIGAIVKDGLAGIVDLIQTVVMFAQTYYIVRGTNTLLEEVGRMDVAERGGTVLKLYIANMVIGMAANLLTVLLGNNGLGLALLVMIVSLVVSIAAIVYYIKYLGAAKECF